MENPQPYPSHGRWLWVLLGAFLVRVAAQPAALLTGWSWLPPFGAWQSGALPYPLLLAAQLLLAAAMTYGVIGVGRRRTVPRPGVGRWIWGAAALYGGVMLTRLVLGATVFRGHWWLDAPLPTVFHLVLTTFLVVYGHYHLRGHAKHPSNP